MLRGAARVVAEAESRQRSELSSLEQERTSLERRIEELTGLDVTVPDEAARLVVAWG